jgi:hypothetical protein
MTKVLMNLDLLDYRKSMKKTLRQVMQHNHIAGIRQSDKWEIPLPQKNLLPPPYILGIVFACYEGQDGDFIMVHVLHDFGIHAMHITIWDDQGNLIERGEVEPFEEDPELWEYYPENPIPLGTKVIAQVTVMDCMSSIAVCRTARIIGEGW